MTVGISIHNGKEAVVITDLRLSGSNRQSDSANKMNTFSKRNYKGVIFGTGLANDIFGLIDNIDKIKDSTLENFVISAHKTYKTEVDAEFEETAQYLKQTLLKEAELLSPENKEKYINEGINELLRQFTKKRDERKNSTLFAVVGYDKLSNKIKLFGFNCFEHYFYNLTHGEIGSGADAAQLYLNSKLQGINTTKLSFNELLFFALNAYSNSTMNQGVGGTPKIAKIKNTGVEIIPLEKTVFLTNISGAHMSDHPNYGLTTTKTIAIINQVIDSKNPNYTKINSQFEAEPISLQLTTPYSSWQESANRKLMQK